MSILRSTMMQPEFEEGMISTHVYISDTEEDRWMDAFYGSDIAREDGNSTPRIYDNLDLASPFTDYVPLDLENLSSNLDLTPEPTLNLFEVEATATVEATVPVAVTEAVTEPVHVAVTVPVALVSEEIEKIESDAAKEEDEDEEEIQTTVAAAVEMDDDAMFDALAGSMSPQELACLVKRRLPFVTEILDTTTVSKLEIVISALEAPAYAPRVGRRQEHDDQVKFAILLLFLKEGKLDSKPAAMMVNQRGPFGKSKALTEKTLRQRTEKLTFLAAVAAVAAKKESKEQDAKAIETSAKKFKMTWRQLKSLVLKFNKALDNK